MVLGLGKIKDGIQRYFRSSEDSSKNPKNKVRTCSEELPTFRRKKKVKAPVSRSSFYVEASFAEDVEATTSFHDAGTDKINTLNDSETGIFSRKHCSDKKARNVSNVYENVCIETIPTTGCPNIGLRLAIATQKPNTEGVQPLTIWNRAYRSEDKPTLQQHQCPEVYWIGSSAKDEDAVGYSASSNSCSHYEPPQRNLNESRNSQIFKWYFGMYETGTDQHALGQTVWKPIDQVKLENPGLSSRKRDSLVPGFIPVTEL